MNLHTSNGMGLQPKGMQLKASAGMGLKPSNGMGLPRSNGMGLASDHNYFKFNEYERIRRYFFSDRGKGRQNATTAKPLLIPKIAGGIESFPKSHIYQTKPEHPPRQRAQPDHTNQPRQQRQQHPREVSDIPAAMPAVQDSSWRPRLRAHKNDRLVAVYCDCFYCELDKLTHTRW